MRVLVVVDMQNDFITGSLSSKEALLICDNLSDYINKFDGEVIFTLDTHSSNYLHTQEGCFLPIEHCIKGSFGQLLINKLNLYAEKNKCQCFEKQNFGSLEVVNYLKDKQGLDEVIIAGVCTDICVIANAVLIKTFLPEIKISVVSSLCAGTSTKAHQEALNVMKSLQIYIN